MFGMSRPLVWISRYAHFTPNGRLNLPVSAIERPRTQADARSFSRRSAGRGGEEPPVVRGPRADAGRRADVELSDEVEHGDGGVAVGRVPDPVERHVVLAGRLEQVGPVQGD